MENNINFFQIEKTTHEEKVKIYKKLKKSELVDMLVYHDELIERGDLIFNTKIYKIVDNDSSDIIITKLSSASTESPDNYEYFTKLSNSTT